MLLYQPAGDYSSHEKINWRHRMKKYIESKTTRLLHRIIRRLAPKAMPVILDSYYDVYSPVWQAYPMPMLSCSLFQPMPLIFSPPE